MPEQGLRPDSQLQNLLHLTSARRVGGCGSRQAEEIRNVMADKFWDEKLELDAAGVSSEVKHRIATCNQQQDVQWKYKGYKQTKTLIITQNIYIKVIYIKVVKTVPQLQKYIQKSLFDPNHVDLFKFLFNFVILKWSDGQRATLNMFLC